LRCLNRNKKKFYYATYVSKTETLDEYSNPTGSYSITYSNPVLMYANVSAARGTADADMFGINLNYDKSVLTDNINCPIAETSVLWVDTMPTIATGGSTTTKPDYIVKQVAKSLNNIAYAIAKVS